MAKLSIPEDFIFFEILARLPVKFLFRLTLICKRWRFLITSLNFHLSRASYLNKSPSFLVNWYFDVHESGFTIVNKDHNNDLIIRINDSILNTCKKIFSLYDSISEISEFLQVNPEEAVRVIGTVHGLVCLCHNFTYGMFFIWNPVTNMLKTVAKPSKDKIIYLRSGFYFDAVDRDFRILQIERYELQSELGRVLLRVEVYSCNLDTWTEIKDDSLPTSEFYIANNLNGRVYVCFRSEPSVLVAFDIHDGVFQRLPCPEHSIDGTEDSPYINWKDSLGIVAYKEPNDLEAHYDEKVVYIYEEASCTWIQKYIAPDALGPYGLLHGSDNGDVVVDKYVGKLALFQAEISQFKDLTSVSVTDVDVMNYTESLVCINGMQQL